MRYAALLLVSVFCSCVQAQWSDMGTGIDDDLTGVYFWNTQHGVLSGRHGVYYTTTGGVGAASWTRFTMTGAPDDQALYDRIRFNALTGKDNTVDVAYCAGTDTVNGQAIVLKVNVATLTWSFLYVGAPGTALNDIGFCSTHLYAVGDHGLLVRSTNLSSFAQVPTGYDLPFHCFSAAGTYFVIGSEGLMLIRGSDNATFDAIPVEGPDIVVHGAQARDLNSSQFGVGPYLYRGFVNSGTAAWSELFDPRPLNGRDICSTLPYTYVATDHGMYRGNGYDALSFLEEQPSSGGADLDDLDYNSFGIYAAGAHGVLLHTINSGGPTIPWVRVESQGGCVNEPFHVNGRKGIITDHQWFLDGVPFTQANMSFDLTIPTLGEHELMVTVTNGTYADTSRLTIQIVAPPLTDMTVGVSDTVLCKEESITLALSSSEADVVYTCWDVTHDLQVGHVNGTGGPVVLTTAPIDLTADLLISASNVHADGCIRWLPDTLHIRVEETKARYHRDLLNALPGEPVDFHARATDAQHFHWDLGPTADTPELDVEAPAGITYSTPGPTTLQLVVWSDAGCYDTLLTEGPFIYEEPPAEDCWTMVLNSIDQDWDGSPDPAITDAKDAGDGFLVAGRTFENVHLRSRVGRDLTLASREGSFLAKYSYQGVLKWVVHSAEVTSTTHYMHITALAVLPDGDIAMAGSVNYDPLVDNTGDTLPVNGYGTTLLARLDAKGRLRWSAGGKGLNIRSIAATPSGELVVAGDGGYPVANEISYWHNGITHPFTWSAEHQWTFLLKTAPDGTFLWQTSIDNYNVNGGRCEMVTVDGNGDIILGGRWEIELRYHSVGAGPVYQVPVSPSGIYGSNAYLAKYTGTGQFQWSLHSPYASADTHVRSIALAGLSAIYVTGRSSDVWLHSDGSNFSFPGNEDFFVMRVDAAGHPEWSNSSASAGWGFGIFADADGVVAVGRYGGGSGYGYMSSIGTPPQWCAAGAGDLFTVAYDHAGALQHVYVPWSTLPNTNGDVNWEATPVFRDTTGNITFFGEFWANGSMEYYGDTLTGTFDDEEADGMIVRPGLNCLDLPTTARTPGTEHQGMKAVPNPSSGDVDLVLPANGAWTLSFTDPLGRVVQRISVRNDQVVHLRSDQLPQTAGPLSIIAVHEGVRYACTLLRVSE